MWVGGNVYNVAEHVWMYVRLYTRKDPCVQGMCMCPPQLCKQ